MELSDELEKVQETHAATSQRYEEVSLKEKEFLKKLTQTQFDLQLEKESMFTVAWSENLSSPELSNFDLFQKSQGINFP